LLLALIAVHAVLLVLAARSRLYVRSESEEAPIEWLNLTPAPKPVPPPASARPSGTSASQRRATLPKEENNAITLPSEPSPATRSGAIDWSAEAELVARQSAARGSGPHERSLDDHSTHGNHQNGLGLSSHERPQFGWYYAGTHRFDTTSGLPVINLSDNCVIPIGALIPLPLCRIGKIPPRGDLFKHMHDTPPEEPSEP
jgi:hypothetical protein